MSPRAKRTPQAIGRLSKKRGSEYENEVCTSLTEYLGVKIKRKLGQARDSGSDVLAGPLYMECKRRRSVGSIQKWMEQCRTSVATEQSKTGVEYIPAVVARGDKKKSLITLELDDFLTLITRAMIRGTALWD